MTKRDKEALLLLISIILTASSWLGFALWQKKNLKDLSTVSQEELKPLNPDVNPNILFKLKERRNIP